MRRRLAAGNWKMNGTRASLGEVTALSASGCPASVDVLICPPATLLGEVARAVVGSGIAAGGQDCHSAASGAHTGDISAAMLADAGATAVILGHSERRTDHGETDALVRAKADAARAAGLVRVICLGETLAERDEDRTLDVVGHQLDRSVPDGATAADTVIAYEPVWAIGTGRTPTLEQIAEVHTFVRDALVRRFGAEGKGIRILYGGSVKPANAAGIFALPDVDGALVGGASLKASDFSAIITALSAA
jgi:triosephosphate isomerase